MADDKITGIIALVAFVGIIAYVFYKREIEPTILTIDWTKVGIIVSIGLISLIILIITGYFLVKKVKENLEDKKQKEYELESQESELNKLLETSFYGSSVEIQKKFEVVKKKIKEFPNEVKDKTKIKEFYNGIQKEIEDKEIQEENRRRKLRQKQLEKEKEDKIFNREVRELLNFKKEKKSHLALPLNKNFSSAIINKATQEARYYFESKQRKKEIRKEAIEYYKKHSLDTKPELIPEMERIYANIRKEIKENKIKLRPEIKYEGEPLENKFYRAKGLDEEIKRKAIAQGYEHVRGNEINGYISPGGFYIKKDMQKESSKHFLMKYLFSELNPKLKIEHNIKGKRADLAYISKKKKIGIEIETGTNKKEQIAKKIKWLNINFDYWIMVCPRDKLPKYLKCVDEKKSFCFTPKKAKDKLLKLIHQ
jgi:uncharacterized membrane protein